MSNFHRQVERRIKKKEQEIQELTDERARLSDRINALDVEIKAANASIEAYRDTLAFAGPKSESTSSGESELRSGSLPALAFGALKAKGARMHITELLQAMGKPVDRQSRTTLAGSLSAYVRRGEIFARPAPNTFALVEWGSPGGGVPEDPEDSGESDYLQ
jgi:septal ring factor EnvC (AmiA/AmiB activator)